MSSTPPTPRAGQHKISGLRRPIGLVIASRDILGPYQDIGHELVTTTVVGSIDPTFYRDNATGKSYIVWKEDYNDPAHFKPNTPILGQQVTEITLDLLGQPFMLVENDNRTWEGNVTEAPWLLGPIGSYLYLFYSGNAVATPLYALGVARSSNGIEGPWEKSPSNPLVHSNAAWSGPGHCSVLHASDNDADGQLFLLYHSWQPGRIGNAYPRLLLMDSLVIDPQSSWPAMASSSAPTATPQPVPRVTGRL